jgi:hypothetical protein
MNSTIKNQSGLDAKKEVVSIEDGRQALAKLQHFMGRQQRRTVSLLLGGEEGRFFAEKMVELAAVVATMPRPYESGADDAESNEEVVQSGSAGMASVAYLHYFVAGFHFYITEKDVDGEQHQAFGLASLGYEPELGYISIEEITQGGAQLDFHFTPAPLSTLVGERDQVQS